MGSRQKMSQMNLRPATMEDACRLFEWRNDIQTRKNSIDMDEVPWEDHVEWLRKSLSSPTRTLMIAERDGVPVGTVRIDREGFRASQLSWTVAPDFRGSGVGREMVSHFADVLTGKLIAYIKRENIASQRIAEATGFRLEQDGELQVWVRP